MVCGRSKMYRQSHSTSGQDTAIQPRVMLDAVWHHPCSSTSDGNGGASSAATLLAARFASDCTEGEMELGSGVGLRERGAFLVGEGSVVGKSPLGVERVDTMIGGDSNLGVQKSRSKGELGAGSRTRGHQAKQNVTCCDDALRVTEPVGSRFLLSRRTYTRRGSSREFGG